METQSSAPRFQRFMDAARELESAGKSVTLRSVRQQAGGGSMSDLTAAMRLYRESAIPQTKGSDETPDAMLVAIKELYRRAQDEASTAVAAERAALAAAQ